MISKTIKEKLNHYAGLLYSEKKIRNIVGSKTAELIWEKHINPTIGLAVSIEGRRGVDVGSGNGLPGVVIASVRPDIEIVLMEPKAGRVNFLEKIKSEMKLDNISVLQMRAEDAGINDKYRGKFDFAVCRAVANLEVSSELVLPLLSIGGVFYSERGKSAE